MNYIETNKIAINKWYKKQQRLTGVLEHLPVLPSSNMGFSKTSGVRPAHIENINKKFTKAIGKAELVRINPILTRNLCFWNSKQMCVVLNAKGKKYNTVLGYNITACPCGMMCSMELHSLLKDNETGELVDLTADFGGETEKWFIPIKEEYDEGLIEGIKFFKGAFYCNTNKEHSCRGIDWNVGSPETLYGGLDKLDSLVDRAQRIHFIR